MVATISVLSTDVSSICDYYTSKARASYYGAEREGIWFGLGARALNLENRQVDPKVLSKTLIGLNQHGRPLAANAKKKGRVNGLDLTMSVPKSVSALWATAPVDVRIVIEECLHAANDEVLKFVETTLPLIRLGKGGIEKETGSMVSASFLHTLSREEEPQLHVHNVIQNLALSGEGHWFSVNSRILHNWTPALGRVFRCTLAQELIRRLEVKLIRAQRGERLLSWFEILGVPQELLKHWSSRSGQINEIVVDLGGGKNASAIAKGKANLITRRSKSKRLR